MDVRMPLIDERSTTKPGWTVYAESSIPTEYGLVRAVVFREATVRSREDLPTEHLALIIGTIVKPEDVMVRVHSECWTGEVLHSLKCDCREQFHAALTMINAAGSGIVLYLRQEGRGI